MAGVEQMTAINEILNAWYVSFDEVTRFGRDLYVAGVFDREHDYDCVDDDHIEASTMLEDFEKPWHWNRQHAWWVANEWPDDAESWERGHDTGWEITT